jgi:predicted secreted protein
MKRVVCLALLWALVAPLPAQDAQETTPTSPSEPAAESSPAADPAALAPALREEVNLLDTESTESMEIPVPGDAPDPRKTGEITEKLPGEEETPKRPEVTGTVEVTAADNGKTVKASIGNLVRITLESNPSTGYNWELRDFDYGVAVFYRSDVVARPGRGNVLFGAPGDTVITIQAVQPGSQDITLVYRRPWEPPDQIEATFQFQLSVAGDEPAPDASPAANPAP